MIEQPNRKECGVPPSVEASKPATIDTANETRVTILPTLISRSRYPPSLIARYSSKLATRRHPHQHSQTQHLSNPNQLHNQANKYHCCHPRHPQRLNYKARPRIARASEYKNLRQVVPSLRRQRDVDKVEVVTEAARYIDHLHKTLIERFVLCGIPDSLKDVLGTDDANELNSQHIMNLVTKMAANQRQEQEEAPSATRTTSTTARRTTASPDGSDSLSLSLPAVDRRRSSSSSSTLIVNHHRPLANIRRLPRSTSVATSNIAKRAMFKES